MLAPSRAGATACVRLADEDLLDLGVKMHLGLFDQHQMQGRDNRVVGRLVLGLPNPHPTIPEGHKAEDHGDKILVTQPVGILR